MANIPIVIVAKILEGALDNDMLKTKSYAELLLARLEEDGDSRAANIIKNRLNGSYKNMPKVVLD